ncbi:MAG: RagB/SusD family nutrient uptake outer membrane protein [Ferruginibacter sp.]|nr:RagB/SusD family nutrient uptake outer membrane protein [Ferruginibacter sp.]
MKKILLILLITPLLFSCEKILDTAPYNSVTDASAFASAARCALALNGVYDAAQGTFYVTGTTENRGYPFGAANITQGDARGEDVVNAQAFYQVTYQATYNSTAANVVAMWKGLYELINKTNIGVAGFRNAGANGVITAALATQYEAECRFLRAMAHHEALIHFARPYSDGNGNKIGVPWREEPITSSAAVNTLLNTPRMGVDSVYIKILADLDFAETNLPEKLFTYRATKAAAIALKMRIKLHKGDWAGVIAEGAKLVPAIGATTPVSAIGGWTLTSTPQGPFINNSSIESIFSIKNDAVDAPSTNAGLSRMYGSASLSGRGLITISPIIYNNAGWLCDDLRKTELTTSGLNSAGNQAILSTKYKDYATWADFAPQIRYAEVLLTLAEAVARNGAGVSADGLTLLNYVRNRSLKDPTNQAYKISNFATKQDLVKAILLERRIEFLAEGKRWGDISRLSPEADYSPGGIPAKAVNGAAGLSIYNCGGGYTPGQAAIAYSDYRFIWPIPSTEVTQNPIVIQNPEY